MLKYIYAAFSICLYAAFIYIANIGDWPRWAVMVGLFALPSLAYFLYVARPILMKNSDSKKKQGSKEAGAKIVLPSTKMTDTQAFEILDLKKGATADDVQQAHRRLMIRNHPDNGGSAYIAALINEAKSTLME